MGSWRDEIKRDMEENLKNGKILLRRREMWYAKIGKRGGERERWTGGGKEMGRGSENMLLERR